MRTINLRAVEPSIADVLARLEEIQAEQAALRALVEQRLPTPQPVRQWMTPAEVAALVGLSPQAITAICRRDGARIGTKVGARWQIDREHFKQYWVERFGKDRVPVALRALSDQAGAEVGGH